MKKFIVKVIIFITLFKTIDIALVSFFEKIQTANISLDSDYGSLNRMYRGLINTDIIALGSSRTYLHINPEIVQNITQKTVWNLGMDGSNADQHFFTLEEYLLHNHAPQVVIFEAEVASLDPEVLRFKTELFLPHQATSIHTMQLFGSNWEERLVYQIASSSAYKGELLQLPQKIKNFWNKTNDTGILTISNVIKIDEEDYFLINGAQIKKGQVPNNLPLSLPFSSPRRDFNFADSTDRLNMYQNLSYLAESKGFVVILLMSPYLDGEVEQGQIEFARNVFSNIANESSNIYFLDFSEAEPFAHDTMLWWNVGHLNSAGANLLSEKISEEILTILRDER